MRTPISNLTRDLTEAEIGQYHEIANFIYTKTGKRVFSMTINPERGNPEKVFGFMVAYDMKQEGE